MLIKKSSTAASTAAEEAAAAVRAAVAGPRSSVSASAAAAGGWKSAAARQQRRQKRHAACGGHQTVAAAAAAAAAAAPSLAGSSEVHGSRATPQTLTAVSSLWLNRRRARRRRLLLLPASESNNALSVPSDGGCCEGANWSDARAQMDGNANGTGRYSSSAPVFAAAPAARRASASASRPPRPAPRCRRQQVLTVNNSAKPNQRAASREAAVEAAAATEGGQQPLADVTPEEADYADSQPEVTENADLALLNRFSRRMRSQLSSRSLRTVVGRSIEANMYLVKSHRHPAQLIEEAENLAEIGVTRSEQISSQHRIAQYLTEANKRRAKKNQNDEAEPVEQPSYPDWIPFKLRFKRLKSKQLWKSFVERRKELAKIMGDRAPAVVKLKDKYNENFIEVWTRSLTVQARPTSIVYDLLGPAFTRLGLDSRVDFKATIGCFVGDVRQGGVKVKGLPKTAVEVSIVTPVSVLYETGVTEIFVTHWSGIGAEFPKGYFDRSPIPDEPASAKSNDADAAGRNQSNARLVRWHLQASQLAVRMLRRGDLTAVAIGDRSGDPAVAALA